MAASEIEAKYSSAKSFLKTQGVLSIIFGSLGVIIGVPLILTYMASVPGYSSQYYYDGGDWTAVVILIIVSFVFWILPHVYMIVAGTHLVRKPTPKLAKGLSIGNVVIGALLNYILLAFAIVSLAQSTNYENGYKKH